MAAPPRPNASAGPNEKAGTSARRQLPADVSVPAGPAEPSAAYGVEGRESGAPSAPPETAPCELAPRTRRALAPLEPAELLYERLQEPSDESPILYRERAYLVDTLQTDDELEEHLEAELSRIRRDWRHRDASQFVQLSLFDHRFHGEPAFPPIATLSWKDWQGRSEIWVRGVRRSMLPPSVPVSVPPVFPRAPGSPELPLEPISIASPRAPADLLPPDAERAELDAEQSGRGDGPPARAALADSTPPELAFDEALGGALLAGAAPESVQRSVPSSPIAGAPSDLPPDSGRDWQSPDKSGEFLIPLHDDTSAAPSSQRVLASDELIGAVFERMTELAQASSLGAGLDFVLALLVEHIACDGALVHAFDARGDRFVVLRAWGPRADEVLGRRMPAARSHLREVLRGNAALELARSDVRRSPGQWPALGLSPEHVVAGPLRREQRWLGAVELCRAGASAAFNAAQVSALEFVCEQLADFLAERPSELARASEHAPPPP